MPTISVITVNLNNKEGLERTVASVASQTTSPDEFIVVDGLSNDGSQEYMEQQSESITKAIVEKDTGVYNAMNKGISAATGDYLLFLNSGDHFESESALAMAQETLSGEDLICFDIAVEGQGKNYIKQHPEQIDLTFMLEDTLAHQSVLVKRSLFERFGLYDESLKIVADWKFFLDALLDPNTTYKAEHQTLTHYYLDGMSATAEGTFKRREERKALMEGRYAFLAKAAEQDRLLQMNRFKMLKELESSGGAKKLNSLWSRIMLRLFRNKSIKDL